MPKKTITLDELSAELERLRADAAEAGTRQIALTAEQKKLLLQARDKNPPVPWERLAKWWREKFGWGSDKTLQRRYAELKRGEN